MPRTSSDCSRVPVNSARASIASRRSLARTSAARRRSRMGWLVVARDLDEHGQVDLVLERGRVQVGAVRLDHVARLALQVGGLGTPSLTTPPGRDAGSLVAHGKAERARRSRPRGDAAALLPAGERQDREGVGAFQHGAVVLGPERPVAGQAQERQRCEWTIGRVDELPVARHVGGLPTRGAEAGLADRGVGMGVRSGEVDHDAGVPSGSSAPGPGSMPFARAYAVQRRRTTSQNTGSISTARHTRPRVAAAISWEPEPANGS